MFSCIKMFLLQIKLKGKQYKQNTSTKSYKTKIKILANLALMFLERKRFFFRD